MNDIHIPHLPLSYERIQAKTTEMGFSMASDLRIGSLLKTLVASKPGGRFLELGTGTGLTLSWMVDGMDGQSRIISIDNDPSVLEVAKQLIGPDTRLSMICDDASHWIRNFEGEKFDLVFADAWPGKYSETNETLNLVKKGGFYVIDDMVRQPNWPDGHHQNVETLMNYLDTRADFNFTKMDWSSGIMVGVRLL